MTYVICTTLHAILCRFINSNPSFLYVFFWYSSYRWNISLELKCVISFNNNNWILYSSFYSYVLLHFSPMLYFSRVKKGTIILDLRFSESYRWSTDTCRHSKTKKIWLNIKQFSKKRFNTISIEEPTNFSIWAKMNSWC